MSKINHEFIFLLEILMRSQSHYYSVIVSAVHFGRYFFKRFSNSFLDKNRIAIHPFITLVDFFLVVVIFVVGTVSFVCDMSLIMTPQIAF